MFLHSLWRLYRTGGRLEEEGRMFSLILDLRDHTVGLFDCVIWILDAKSDNYSWLDLRVSWIWILFLLLSSFPEPRKIYRICFLCWVFASCRFFLPQIEADAHLACLDRWTLLRAKVWEGRMKMNGFIYSSVWEFNRKKWNSYNGMLLFHSLLNPKHSSQK